MLPVKGIDNLIQQSTVISQRMHKNEQQYFYHQQNYHPSNVYNPKNVQPQSQFHRTHQNVIKIMNRRSEMVDVLLDRVQKNQGDLDPEGKNKIIVHCNSYSPISGLLHKILSKSTHQNPLQKQQKFWQENQRLQRYLQEELRKLKIVDTAIDNIVNEQFDKCNQIDEIQETIRVILSKKDHDHIRKAEPYYQKKQNCMDFLSLKKGEKQQAKNDKQNLVKNILQLLSTLKQHRQLGLKQNAKMSNKDRHEQENQARLINKAIKDIKEIQNNRKQLNQLQKQSKDLLVFVADLQKKITNKMKQLNNLMENQNQASFQLQRLSKLKGQTIFFQKTFFQLFGISDIANRSKSANDYNSELGQICQKMEEYVKQDTEKQKQMEKIKQGIETTDRTIEIFGHILQKIENQNQRRNQLLSQIQKIQQWHNSQDQARDKLAESETELQKLMIKNNRLEKNLGNKIDQADVNAYKSIHSEIEQIQVQIGSKRSKIEQMRNSIGENAKNLYDWTIALQEDYSDILSEVVPSVWFRDNDFRKEENIKDLNLYLLKTFKRLSIAD